MPLAGAAGSLEQQHCLREGHPHAPAEWDPHEQPGHDDEAFNRATRAGGFGCVVGVDRAGQADQLREHGADVVVTDLAELLDRS